MNRLGLAATLASALLSGACGYHVAGRGDALPKTIKTIAIPAFSNSTTLYHLADRLSADITREFISRTHYRVTMDPGTADAVLTGAVVKYFSYATTLDPTTARASAAQLMVTISITLTDRATGKVIYSRNIEAHERYEVSPNSQSYFEESDAALGRMSRNVARDAVSAILEKF